MTEIELDRHLAEPLARPLRLGDDLFELIARDDAEVVQHFAEPLVGDVRDGADHVAAVEEDRATALVFVDDELTAPRRLLRERHHVAEAARRRDLSCDLQRGGVAVAPEEDRVARARDDAPLAGAGAELLAPLPPERVNGPRGVDAHEVGSLGHLRMRVYASPA